MSDFTKPDAIDDIRAKLQRPNHLATRLEKQAAAGASLPQQLDYKYRYLQNLTQLARTALSGILPAQILSDCYVVATDAAEITLSLGSPTAANHMRYVMIDCVQALRSYDQRFCHLQHIKVILSPKSSQSDARPDTVKQILSENTRRIIAQQAQFVTPDSRLHSALLALASDKTATNIKK